MAKTFYLFPRFPAEIRLEIWSMAVRDVRAQGVHFLGVRPLSKHESIKDCNTLTFTAPPCGMRCKAPLWPFATLSGYWEHANPSTYLSDGGMWTACRESRRMMLRKFYPPEKPHCLDEIFNDFHMRQGDPVIGLLSDACLTTPRWLAVFPDRDLVILRADHLECFKDKALLFGLAPVLQREFAYVGVEYDPAWGRETAAWGRGQMTTMMEEVATIVDIFAEAALGSLSESVIFLIDYRLKCGSVGKTRKEGALLDFAASGGWFVCDQRRQWHVPSDDGDGAAPKEPTGEGKYDDDDDEDGQDEDEDSLMRTDASIYPCADFVKVLEHVVEEQYAAELSAEGSDSEENADCADCHNHAVFNILTWCPS